MKNSNDLTDAQPIERIESDEDAEAHLRERLANTDYTEGAEYA